MIGNVLLNFKKYFGLRVIIYGKHSQDWNDALAPDAPVWKRIAGISEVLVVDSAAAWSNLPKQKYGTTVIIPLMEDHIANCPRDYPLLIPEKGALRIFRDKANFASYAEANGLAVFCPRRYSDFDTAIFPCVLKRTNLNAGTGIKLVTSAQHLKDLLNQDMWRDHSCILQEFIPGIEYVTHAVCKSGKILWHQSYKYETEEQKIRCDALTALPAETPASRLREMESFLQPLDYSGPCNLGYKLTEDGHVMMMEINPRLGGSLMVPGNVKGLQAALTCIIDNAYKLSRFSP